MGTAESRTARRTISGRNLAVVLTVVLLVGSVTGFLVYNSINKSSPSTSSTSQTNTTCAAILGGRSKAASSLQTDTFGAITEFNLPNPARYPNALAVAPDGSVWFGEVSLPGVGHLFRNGSLVEYPWTTNASALTRFGGNCGVRTDIWGVALWNGSVWASDSSGNDLVGLSPASGVIQKIKFSIPESFPYSLVVAPDGSLWFTLLYASKIGRLMATGNYTLYSLPTGSSGTPTDIAFVNNTLGYYSDAGIAGQNNGGVYSFDPRSFHPTKVGTGKTLSTATSIAPTRDGVWVSQHFVSQLDFYDIGTKTWTAYPTSLEKFAVSTLPYFVRTSGSNVWFNEHYGNRMAILQPNLNRLTEYSISNPPVTNETAIANTLTFGVSASGAWFSEFTGNKIGFVNPSYVPSFMIEGNATSFVLARGGEAKVLLTLTGSDNRLLLNFSDSETISATPKNITMIANVTTLHLSGKSLALVTIRASSSIEPGNYTLLLTAGDGFVYRSIYIRVVVT